MHRHKGLDDDDDGYMHRPHSTGALCMGCPYIYRDIYHTHIERGKKRDNLWKEKARQLYVCFKKPISDVFREADMRGWVLRG